MTGIRWTINSPEVMQQLGNMAGRCCVGGEVFLLSGPLGAGKTQFIKGLGEGIGVRSVVNSPTFNLLKSHVGKKTLHHADLYRLNSEIDCAELGLEDLLDPDSILAVEWAERYPALKTEDCLLVDIAIGDGVNKRIFTITGTSPESKLFIKDLILHTPGLKGETLS